jgi:AcrR family transcriptional regulator
MADKESRKKKITVRRREQILPAALEVFSRKGYAAATIPEIAKAAGIAAGTIYLYFPGKRELFVAVIKNLIITTPLLDLIHEMPQGNIDIIFKHILRERFDLIKNPAFAQMPSLIGEIQRDPDLKAIWLQDFFHPFLERIETGYRLMTASGKLRRMEPAVLVRVIGGMFIGFLMLKLIEGEASPLNRLPEDKVVDDMVNFVLHGLMGDGDEKKSGKEETK